jgi:predicted NAD/FAD-dependent oxidoreductase
MTAIAKELAQTLRVKLTQRVTQILLDGDTWRVTTEAMAVASQPMTLKTKAVVLAIPSPQALELCIPLIQEGLSPAVTAALQNVQFDPCITVIASYAPSAPWQTLPWAGAHTEVVGDL